MHINGCVKDIQCGFFHKYTLQYYTMNNTTNDLRQNNEDGLDFNDRVSFNWPSMIYLSNFSYKII